MNDRPSPGQYPDPGYDGLTTTTFAGDSTYVSYETQGQGVNYAAYGSYETGAYDATAWASQGSYVPTIPSQGVPADTTGQWDASAWSTPGAEYPGYAGYQPASFGYDTSAEQTGHWALPGYGTTGTETGAYDATAWNTVTETPAPAEAAYPNEYAYEYQPAQQYPGQYEHQQHEHQPQEHQHQQQTYDGTAYAYEAQAAYEPEAAAGPAAEPEAPAAPEAYSETAVFEAVPGEEPDLQPSAEVHDLPTQAMPVTPPSTTGEPRSARRTAAKANAKAGGKANAKAAAKASSSRASSRRRTPAKRSALLTVAVPSACVMGVAGVAAASVGGLTGTEKPAEDTTTMAAPDPASVKPVAANTKLDTQLAALSADAGDFADRASRTQERIDLRQRQEDEKKKKAEEAAAKEAARPKFAIPVAQQGLSASFGQSGGMWMSVHTGIDFPVAYGTPVMAATDGTVRTQYNSAYGNMAIVTAPDGTETWYCHLSSTKIRGGKVKAGEVIAYSGNSGNSTGPHLHFEVRPGGGSAIDPMPWFRTQGLNPS
ncbi:M23 family metallopeptidase [Streptomyces sp. NBC_01408]|uniref:M23 family metallopeptidase n=1 Tax=Streptomyces sp. NBC_01408 TaxID=2903855 RepID=UPI0022547FF3|nr:M23 family metallopeptidase [Streptomyces sp. NBC_01408]MCX4691476.1 M23 family metallopeptidase [Streptomyces sp. NBC_01408]